MVATERLCGIPRVVSLGLLAWVEGQRRVELLGFTPSPDDVLARQARGERCVSLLPPGVSTGAHEDAFAFVLHDVCHMEKFFDPEHHIGQVGFFSLLHRARQKEAWRSLTSTFDDAWTKDLGYVMADMNGSAIFLFAALKMKVKMAVRRDLARRAGVAAPQTGPLSDDERQAYAATMAGLYDVLAFDDDVRAWAERISTKRDHPDAARALLAYFESVGREELAS